MSLYIPVQIGAGSRMGRVSPMILFQPLSSLAKPASSTPKLTDPNSKVFLSSSLLPVGDITQTVTKGQVISQARTSLSEPT